MGANNALMMYDFTFSYLRGHLGAVSQRLFGLELKDFQMTRILIVDS